MDAVMRVVFWGTYDKGKPRTRILLRGLRENGVEVLECHADVWSGIEDKSRISGAGWVLRLLLRWLGSYPGLILRYLKLPDHDAVVGYMGYLDVLILWPLAKFRGVPIVWDVFVPLFNTVVEDRRLVSARNPAAWLIYLWERLASRAADLVLLDTRAHCDYFAKRFSLPEHHVADVLVGVEPEVFPPRSSARPIYSRGQGRIVLFYGQFARLHGIDTIIRAARILKDDPISWVLIGRGQEEEKLRAMLREQPLPRLEWIPWVRYEDLVSWIHRADVCLGIFGDTAKAGRVIPNKVFQILSARAPLITRDSAAVRELVTPGTKGVSLVPSKDPGALAKAILIATDTAGSGALGSAEDWTDRISPKSVGRRFRELLEQF